MITEFNINSNLGKDTKLLQIKEYIDVNKIKNKNYKVLDVGGGVRNKADIQIDALFDLNDDVMNDENKGIRVIKKDFCEKDAWQTIDDKSYGFCNSCGEEIGIKRLEARPVAKECIDCKTLAEEKEKVS